MTKSTLQEAVVLLALLGVAGLVFFETIDTGTYGRGQTAPGTFPRMAAALIAVLALTRLVTMLRGKFRAEGNYDWSWSTIRRVVAATVLMVLFYLLFRVVPFAVLVPAFIFLIFLAFDVRPMKRLLIGGAISSATLYVLFVYLIRIPV